MPTGPYHLGDGEAALLEGAWFAQNSEDSTQPVGKPSANQCRLSNTMMLAANVTAVKQMVEGIAQEYGKSNRIGAKDRGMTSAGNLK
ncbi:MAG TPA: hypothetical protein PKD64_01595 [Pirellulaceae bacterium]|nr:hypothetical protein [Pirellulaceae bacterium]HMO90863.1 hypothetical protein [Pirellulaceae bacterium]HMP68661.1 hypothetical protein [Pirellulaceae bacterium]